MKRSAQRRPAGWILIFLSRFSFSPGRGIEKMNLRIQFGVEPRSAEPWRLVVGLPAPRSGVEGSQPALTLCFRPSQFLSRGFFF